MTPIPPAVLVLQRSFDATAAEFLAGKSGSGEWIVIKNTVKRLVRQVVSEAEATFSHPDDRLSIDPQPYIDAFIRREVDIRCERLRVDPSDFRATERHVGNLWATFSPSELWEQLAAKHAPA